MGSGKIYSMKEIDETRAAGRDEEFELILEKIEEKGGEITEDDIHPLYTVVGTQEFEMGTERIVLFSINGTDFEITRKVETHNLQGSGHQKHIEDLKIPRVNISLKKKAEYSDDWTIVDMDEMGGLL